MYFSRIFTWFLLRKEVILTKSSLLCESCNKFSSKCKLSALNNEAILTILTKRNSAIFKLFNCLNQASLMSSTQH